MYQFTITITGTYSIALMKNPIYDRTFVLGHKQWFLAGQQCLVALCKLEDHFREARKQVPAGQSSPVQSSGFWNKTTGEPANDQIEPDNGNFRNHVPKYS